LCARNTSVAIPTTTARSRMREGEGEISWALAAAALLTVWWVGVEFSSGPVYYRSGDAEEGY
jgi:hypothetical protein